MRRDTRLLVTDVDGVWTDCTVWVDADGRETLRYSKRDGVLLPYMRQAGIEVVALTSEQRDGPHRARAAKLGIEIHTCSPTGKLASVRALAEARGLTLAQVAYIGDDLPDMPVLHAVTEAGGASFAPYSSPAQGCAEVAVVEGGRGSLRDACETLLDAAGWRIDVWPPATPKAT